MMKNSTIVLVLSVLLSFGLVSNSLSTTTTHSCPAKCTITGIRRNSLYRVRQDCPNYENFVKCYTSLWLVGDGTLTVSFDGDLPDQVTNENLTTSLPDQLFYHHTQVKFYANVSETNVNVRNTCFDQDDCSRIFAQKMADQLLGYEYIQLEQRIKPIIYDPTANTEIQFFTPDLYCAADDNNTRIPCNTTCYVLSSSIGRQRLCWLGTIVSLHVYTENALPAPINTAISLSYNCNTHGSLCNGPDVLQNITGIVNDFFRNPPYVAISNSCVKCSINLFFLIMNFLFVFYIVL